METLEQRLTQSRQDAAEQSNQFDHSERELRAEVETLQQRLLSVQNEREQEREKMSERLKKMTTSSSQAQSTIQTKDKVYKNVPHP